jgi:hypothetical protein
MSAQERLTTISSLRLPFVEKVTANSSFDELTLELKSI